MSSDDQQPIRQRRRRALNINNEQPVAETDIFDPGPTIHYPPLPVGQDGLPTPPAIRQRVRDLRANFDRRASKEFILHTLHTFLLAYRPVDEIARAFGVSVQRVYQWREELYHRIGNEFKNKTPTELLSREIAELERAKGIAWGDLLKSRSHNDRNRSINTIATCTRLLADLYERCGMVGKSTISPVIDIVAEDVTGKSTVLQKLASEFLLGDYAKKKSAEPRTIEQNINDSLDDSDYLF